MTVLAARQPQIHRKGAAPFALACERQSVAGSVSQRACVFCGARVVLYPIADALHLVHGPVGCAAYTWDIRGALSSGPQLHRMSFSTDVREAEVIHGGERKLAACLDELITRLRPRAAFVYATCIVGLIGDDLDAVCRRAAARHGIDVIPVHAPGFGGSKSTGYQAACTALARLVGTAPTDGIGPLSINILGDFNIAGETWIVRRYYQQMGVEVVATVTGDGRVDDIRRCHGARLNVVQCSGSMVHLARHMKEKYGIPYVHVSYFGIEDTAAALYRVAEFFGAADLLERTRALVRHEIEGLLPELAACRDALRGRKAAIYTGGAFKALSLVNALRLLGIDTVIVGSQTGKQADYEQLQAQCDEGTVILDDTNPLELVQFIKETGADLLIGGVKERPLAYKLGVAFCDHNHERKLPLAGFEGMRHFARELRRSLLSPVWRWTPRFAPASTAIGEHAT